MAQDRGVSVDDDPDYLRAYEHLTLARLLLAERAAQRSGCPEVGSRIAALGLLQRLRDAAVDAGRDGSVLEIRILQALAHYADGDRPEALAALSCALVEGPEPDSYVRLYRDEGAPMLALLRDAAASPVSRLPVTERGLTVRCRSRSRSRSGDSSSERRRQRPGPSDPAPAPALGRPVEPPRTSGCAGSSTPSRPGQRSRALYVSLNTFRTHTKSIFTKLDVTTRAAAVRRAHERGLV